MTGRLAVSGLAALVHVATVIGCNAAPPPVCDGDELRAVLASAIPGDRVELGACTISGTFAVPEGVTLSGQGVDATLISGTGDAPALDVRGGTTPTTIQLLSIQTPASGAIRAEGGVLAVRDVGLRLDGGPAYGLLVVEAASVQVERLSVEGPLVSDPDAFPGIPTIDDPKGVAITVTATTEAVLTDVHVRGAISVVWSVESQTTWQGGSAATFWHGIEISGGRAVLESVALADDVAAASLGGVLVSSGALVASDLQLQRLRNASCIRCETGTTAELTDVLIEDCAHYGIAMIGGRRFVLQGDGTQIRSTAGAGVILNGVEEATLRGGRIANTVQLSADGYFSAGDGIAVVRSLDTSISDVSLEDNARVGLFVDACPDPRTLPVFDRVVVTGTGEQRGAYARIGLSMGGSAPPRLGWDEGISRLGTTAVNDATEAPLEPYETTDCPP